MLISEITLGNAALLKLMGVDKHSIINPKLEEAMQVLLQINSPSLNRGYIQLLNNYIQSIEKFLATSFEHPDPEIDLLKQHSNETLQRIKTIMSQLRL